MVGQSIGLRWLFEWKKRYRSASCYPGFLQKKRTWHTVTRTYFRSAIGKKQCQNSKPFISDFKYDRRLEVKIHLSLHRILTFLNHGMRIRYDCNTMHCVEFFRILQWFKSSSQKKISRKLPWTHKLKWIAYLPPTYIPLIT